MLGMEEGGKQRSSVRIKRADSRQWIQLKGRKEDRD
jgi:hypothetical protein